MGMLHHPSRNQREKSREAQIGDNDHHAEEQRDGFIVDCGIGIPKRQRVRRDHQAGANDGGAGAIEPQARDSADGQRKIRKGEDEDRNPHVLIMKVSL